MTHHTRTLAAALLLAASATAQAADGGQQFAVFERCELDGGGVIEPCRIGYRTWGRLNVARDNAVLLPTWFTGGSADFETWDYVGPGKTIDPERWFVIAADALGNGVSSSPSNTYDFFPDITIGDMVATQHRLLTETLGIDGLHAVFGISMGGMQAYEWLVRYPGFANRVVTNTGTPWQTAQDRLLWDSQRRIIGELGPTADAALALSAIDALSAYTPGYVAGLTGAAAHSEFLAQFHIDAPARKLPDRDAQLAAMLAHDIRRSFGGDVGATAKAIGSEVLVIVSPTDQTVNPGPSRDLAGLTGSRVIEFDGNCGHYDSFCGRDAVAEAIREFLDGN